jgi:hypothetical protein
MHQQIEESEEIMIIILSYSRDGSGTPEIAFFPKSDHQVGDVAIHTVNESELNKSIRIYEITELDLLPDQIYPRDQRK